VLEQVELPQEAEGKELTAIVQLLEGDDGARLVRFAYSNDGVSRRGPVTFRPEDLVRLRRRLRSQPELARALRLEG